MPKIKTVKSAAKRFKRTASGKLKRKQGFRQHDAWAKTKKQRRQLSKPALVHPTDAKRIETMLPR
jgi:large subunit ribosomal protein L35